MPRESHALNWPRSMHYVNCKKQLISWNMEMDDEKKEEKKKDEPKGRVFKMFHLHLLFLL